MNVQLGGIILQWHLSTYTLAGILDTGRFGLVLCHQLILAALVYLEIQKI